jgi:hypothetical protein
MRVSHVLGAERLSAAQVKKVGSEWKFNAMGLAGGVENDMDSATWP